MDLGQNRPAADLLENFMELWEDSARDEKEAHRECKVDSMLFGVLLLGSIAKSLESIAQSLAAKAGNGNERV